MKRVTVFTFRVSTDERQMIADLAAQLQRSQSDVIRMLLRKAVSDLSKKLIIETITEKGTTYDHPITKA